MKGEIRYAVACVFPAYTSGTPMFWNRFTDYTKPATKILEVPQEVRNKAESLYKYDPPEWRSIWRKPFAKPIRVLEIGSTYIRLGYMRYLSQEEGNVFIAKDQLKVYRVVPFPEGNGRYHKPFEALILDLMISEEFAMEETL